MPKIKVKKGSVTLDMTAMCDVAFLLLTFFVLTAKAKPQEPVDVVIPSSVIDFAVPELDIITLLIDKPGRVFIGMDNHDDARKKWLNGLSSQFNLKLDEYQQTNFINGGVIPVPAEKLGEYLSANGGEKKDLVASLDGIPVDTSNTEANQLKDWLINARRANGKARVVIKADAQAPYSTIKQVMATLKKQNIMKFSLLTSQAAD